MPRVAVMLVVPATRPVARPVEEMVATVAVPDVQVAEVVMLAVVPSL